MISLLILYTFRKTWLFPLWGKYIVSFLLPAHLSWAIEETSYFRAGQNGEGKMKKKGNFNAIFHWIIISSHYVR